MNASNIAGGAVILALIVFGAWLINALAESQKAQECLESRRRDCRIIHDR